jgi:hypothetical protein
MDTIALAHHTPSDPAFQRTSSLLVTDDCLRVLGNLPHGYEFTPASQQDACELIAWLSKWIRRDAQDSFEKAKEQHTRPMSHEVEA